MTIGQRATSENLNLTEEDLEDVERCKEVFADLIDVVADIRNKSKTPSKIWQCTVAIIELETAQMRMTKAIKFIDE